MAKLEAESVQCCVTSPPYWQLRDYQTDGQIGLEETPQEFITKLVDVFREVRRIIRKDGTVWLNMGDSYATKGSGKQSKDSEMGGRAIADTRRSTPLPFGYKAKDMMGMPWRLAFALQDDGWYLRQEIIWAKNNPMPESISDRCCKSHEHIFLLTKSPQYFFDAEAIKEPVSGTANARGNGVNAKIKTPDGWDTTKGKGGHGTIHKKGRSKGKTTPRQNPSFSAAVNELVSTRNKRSVWQINTEACKEAHFATFPRALVRPCILAGTKPGDMVVDPFGGSGTTGLVAVELGRNATLFELNPEYAKIAEARTNVTPGFQF
jgi:DNA modification methylase